MGGGSTDASDGDPNVRGGNDDRGAQLDLDAAGGVAAAAADEGVDPDDLADEEPGAIAGGVARAIDDDRDDFHDIRNDAVAADDGAAALDVLEERLDDDEFETALEQIDRHRRLAEAFDTVEDPGEVEFGQRVLVEDGRGVRVEGIVDDVDADGTVWVNKEHRDVTSGIDPTNDAFTLWADPEGGVEGAGEVGITADAGRFGIASDETVLNNPFEAADEVVGARQAGIQEGNTTGDELKIAEMPDGSRVFLTPTSAYGGYGGLDVNADEALVRNRDGPAVVEAFGGGTCRTTVVEFEDETYIAKEGVEGELLSDRAGGRGGGGLTDAEQEAVAETYAAGYFAGNYDLHGANVKVHEGEAYIIDHDSQDEFSPPHPLATRSGADHGRVREHVVEKARAYAEGDIQLPDDVSSETAATVREQVRTAYTDYTDEIFAGYDQSPLGTFDGSADAEPGATVTFVDDLRVQTAELVSPGDQELEVRDADGAVKTIKDTQLLEVDG